MDDARNGEEMDREQGMIELRARMAARDAVVPRETIAQRFRVLLRTAGVHVSIVSETSLTAHCADAGARPLVLTRAKHAAAILRRPYTLDWYGQLCARITIGEASEGTG